MLDNLKVNNYERSLFMIKPDSYIYKEKILQYLRKKNFELQYVKDVILTSDFLEGLYGSEENEIIRSMNIKYFSRKLATVGIVAGEDAKERLFELCGTGYIPDKCGKETIRYKYSTLRKPILINGHEFYVNAIHRSLPQDSEREIELYMNEYVRKKQERENNYER